MPLQPALAIITHVHSQLGDVGRSVIPLCAVDVLDLVVSFRFRFRFTGYRNFEAQLRALLSAYIRNRLFTKDLGAICRRRHPGAHHHRICNITVVV